MIQIRVAAAKRKEEDDEVLHQKREIETSKGRQGYWNLLHFRSHHIVKNCNSADLNIFVFEKFVKSL